MLHALMIFQAVVSILLIILVLLQFGKGAEAGLLSGGGASDAAFSTAQKGNILTKITTVLAVIFLAGAVKDYRIDQGAVSRVTRFMSVYSSREILSELELSSIGSTKQPRSYR
jgi:preprotein translocase subunit SecG